MSSTELPPDAPKPRLCHLIKWPDFDGYGFNLHAEKSKPGQFIGKVDEGSPAQAAGLRTTDRIVEVNGVNIANENHKQVVERIKAVLYETKLLVVDDVTDKWYKERKLVIKGTQSNVKYIKTPDTRIQFLNPSSSSDANKKTPTQEEEEDDEDDDNESFKSLEQGSQTNSKGPSVTGSAASTPSSSRKENDVDSTEQSREKLKEMKINENLEENDSYKETIENSHSTVKNDDSPKGIRSEPPQRIEPSPKIIHEAANGNASTANGNASTANGNASTANGNASTGNGNASTGNGSASINIPPASSMNGGDKLNLNMSVQEMRAMLASRKKHDPKKDTMDFRQKYAIIQDM